MHGHWYKHMTPLPPETPLDWSIAHQKTWCRSIQNIANQCYLELKVEKKIGKMQPHPTAWWCSPVKLHMTVNIKWVEEGGYVKNKETGKCLNNIWLINWLKEADKMSHKWNKWCTDHLNDLVKCPAGMWKCSAEKKVLVILWEWQCSWKAWLCRDMLAHD